MSEKHLTELPWVTLAKKQKIKDAGLGKALADYGTAGEKDHAARLAAIEEIKSKAKKLKKDNESNEEAAEYLDEVVAEAEKTRKALAAVTRKRTRKKKKAGKRMRYWSTRRT